MEIARIGLNHEAPLDTIAFHIQQCAEKLLKSVLTFREIEFPRTHDLKAFRIVREFPRLKRLAWDSINRMPHYSQFIDALLSDTSLLQKLRPSEMADPYAAIRVREATDSQLAEGKTITNEGLFPLVRGALLYAVDAIDQSYGIVSKITGDTAVYWCGMIHRRQGDFFNARNCFRRVGTHPVFGILHSAAAEVSPDMAKQWDWDPYLFVGMCEQEKYGDNKHSSELIKLQRVEFDAFLDYVWRKSLAA